MSSLNLSDAEEPVGAKKVSEPQIVAGVQRLNNTIAEFVSALLDGVRKLGISLRPRPSTQTLVEGPRLLRFFFEADFCDDVRLRVAESIIFDWVSWVVFMFFFDGCIFHGVGSDSIRDMLERMLMILRRSK
jgi:hypothetical protein